MEAIKAIAKRTKAGKYKIDLPINNTAEEIAVMVIVGAVKKRKKRKKLLKILRGNLSGKEIPLLIKKALEMSGIKFLLDTNSVFHLLQGKLNYFKNDLDLNEIAISIITKMVFLSNSNLNARDIYLFENFLERITVFYLTELDEKLVNETVRIRKKYKLKLPDAIIASTALSNNLTLISADDVYSKIFNLKFKFIAP